MQVVWARRGGRWSVPLRPNTSGGEKGSGYSFPHWEAGKGQASQGSGPQLDDRT